MRPNPLMLQVKLLGIFLKIMSQDIKPTVETDCRLFDGIFFHYTSGITK
jgi:hypothetical protein